MPVLFVKNNRGILFIDRLEQFLEAIGFLPREITEEETYSYYKTLQDKGITTVPSGIRITDEVLSYFESYFSSRSILGKTSFTQPISDTNYPTDYFKESSQGVATSQVMSDISYFEELAKKGGVSQEMAKDMISYFEELRDQKAIELNTSSAEQLQSIIDYFLTFRQ